MGVLAVHFGKLGDRFEVNPKSWTQHRVQMSRSFTYEEKLSAIGLVLQGKSVRSVSNELHLGNHLLYEWVEIYHLFGPEG